MGFQIQDDLLDIFADESELGKKVGSDLAMNKKTILTTKLTDLGKAPNSLSDLRVFKNQLISEGIDEEVSKMVESYFTKAYSLLKKIPDSHHKDTLRYLTDIIKNRDK
jgi:geranylgeranyl diphosphate synthase type II